MGEIDEEAAVTLVRIRIVEVDVVLREARSIGSGAIEIRCADVELEVARLKARKGRGKTRVIAVIRETAPVSILRTIAAEAAATIGDAVDPGVAILVEERWAVVLVVLD